MSDIKKELNSIRDILLRGGVRGLYFGISPDQRLFVKCEQQLVTGTDGNICEIAHQKVGASIGECLNALATDMEQVAPMHRPPTTQGNKLIQIPGGG